MIDGQNLFDEPVKSNFRIYDNIWKIATSQGDDYTTSFLLDYKYFNKNHKMIALYLSKQQGLNFTGNLALEGNANTKMFFIIEEDSETVIIKIWLKKTWAKNLD